MEIKLVEIEKTEDLNLVLGQSHFIKTVEDISEALVTAVPKIKFGLAFCESSGPRLIRHYGTDGELEKLAIRNAEKIGAGHSFIVLLRNVFPINILQKIKNVEEVVSIFAATSNPIKIIVLEDGEQKGIIGVLDGLTPIGVESKKDINERKKFLRDIGYKF